MDFATLAETSFHRLDDSALLALKVIEKVCLGKFNFAPVSLANGMIKLSHRRPFVYGWNSCFPF